MTVVEPADAGPAEPIVTNRQLPTVTPSPATGHVVLHAPDNGTEAMVDAVPSQLGRQP